MFAIVKETAVNIWEDIRPDIGYAVIPDIPLFEEWDDAVTHSRSNNLPLGWVIMPLSQLFSGYVFPEYISHRKD